MLVKLGKIWVNPAFVEAIFHDMGDGGVYYRNTAFREPISLGVGNEQTADEYAEAVNLVKNQSYGNTEDAVQPE